MSAGERPTAVLAALAANLGIAVAKFVAFLATRSSAMLAESIHSAADTTNEALLLLGQRRADHAATEQHPFGFGLERYFWSFVVAVMLFTVGAVFSLIQGVEKFRSPEAISSPAWAIGVLLVAMVFEGLSLRTAVREARTDKSGFWWQYIRRTKKPETAVILLEDTAAEAGLVLALLGVGLSLVTGNSRFDALGSVGIGLLLAFVAAVLAIEMRSLLIGEAGSPDDLAVIRAAVEEEPSYERLIELRTMHLGPSDLLIAMRVELDDRLTFDEVARRLDDIEDRIRSQLPSTGQVFIEADTGRGVRGSAEEQRPPDSRAHRPGG